VHKLWERHDHVSDKPPRLPPPILCAISAVDRFLPRVTSFNSDTTNADRAPITMSHDTQHLTISREEANRIDEEAKRRLLANRKLSLVVDLDQTIIHAAVDPTIAEWQKDKDNPNYEAVKDVRAFQLIDDGPGMRGCWYYIKLRPGLMEFLENVSQIYELHIYTMGTRQYAQQIANIVDPDRKYFGERILSRDESGSMIAKNLERLFPVDTKMVVIIDDRGDVWKWSANLIRVTPFDFFVGIGDINSSFLPKKQEIQATPLPENKAAGGSQEAGGDNATKNDRERPTNGTIENGTNTDTSALEQLVAMGGGDDPTIRQIQSKGREVIISTQVEEKPLEKMQREQDERDEKEEAAAAASMAESPSTEALANGDSQISATESDSSDTSSDSSTTTPSSSPKPKARHSILRNDDQELIYLQSRLEAVHAAFFNEYDRKRLGGKGGRVAALTGKRKIALSPEDDDAPSDLLFVPDVKKVMPAMKMRVLAGVTIVFSGVLPLGTDVQNADIAVWAKTFGATITEKVGRGVTHVIAARPGTAKVKQATKRGGIKVVGTNWLLDCIQQWRKLDERPYYIIGTGPDGASADDIEGGRIEEHYNPMEEPGYPISSEDDTTGVDTEDEVGQPERKRLKLNTGEVVAKDGDDVIDDQSPLTIDQDEWADIDKELKEFMGSDAESDSDTDSAASALSVRLGKRKRAGGDTDDDEGDGGKPAARDRGGTGLRTVANAASETGSSGSRTPATDMNGEADEVIEREQREIEEEQRKEEAEEEESDDELARELEREMESMDDEEDAQDEVGFMGPIEDDG
jgi:RNA polymerase II subunit A C-terminal domain phosphatase